MNHFMFIYQRYGNKEFPFAQKLSFLGIACLSINAALHPEAWKGKEEIIVSAEAIYPQMKTGRDIKLKTPAVEMLQGV